MKGYLSVLFFVLSHTTTLSQEIIAFMVDGTPLEQEAVLLDGDQCCFRMKDGRNADWKIYIDMPNGEFVLKELDDTSEIIFKVTPEYKERLEWRPSRYIVNSDAYWKCHARSLDKDGNTSERAFYLLVLPSTPQIKGVDAQYDGFGIDCLCFQNARVCFLIESQRAKTAVISCQYENCNSVWTNDLNVSVGVFDDNEVSLKTDYQEWDVWERYYIHTSNSYGVSESSDTVYMADYITDLSVRDALGLTSTKIDIAPKCDHIFDVAGGVIKIADGMQINYIDAFTLQGQPVPYFRQGNTIFLSREANGVVVIRIKSNTIFVTKKIVL